MKYVVKRSHIISPYTYLVVPPDKGTASYGPDLKSAYKFDSFYEAAKALVGVYTGYELAIVRVKDRPRCGSCGQQLKKTT